MKYKIVKSTEKDKEWLFDLHKKTMKEYVNEVYGWDELKEIEYFNDKEKLDKYYIIFKNDEKVGAINFYSDKKIVKIYRIEILPNLQNRGIGSWILDNILGRLEKSKNIVELRVFKINPAQRLYLRKGFSIYKESDTHYYMRYEK